LSFFEKEYAVKTQTLVFGKEKKQLYILTTNNFPLLHAQVLDRLNAQDYTYQVRYTDDSGFQQALLRYDQRDEERSVHEATWRHEHSVKGREAVLLLKEIFAKRESYTAENEFLNDLLRLSFQAGASDLHFQSEEIGVVMRLRRDGLLETICIFSHTEFLKYMMKLKFMAGVKMNVETESQDGRMDFEVELADKKSKIDIRVSIMP
jgi:type II secretory ATPase GspE/PulE/Tfp pilus assembly ATPase PilB-like protein